MYSIGIAAELLGVCIKTLRRWEKSRRIRCIRTPGGHRRFPIQEIKRILKGERESYNPRQGTKHISTTCAIYGRVSSHKQNKRGDLDRQIAVLKQYASDNFLTVYNVYKDVGSGLNTKRKGLWRMLRDAKHSKFSVILVNYKDRLTRFGYKYVKNYLSEFGVNIRYLHTLNEKTPESEMVEDLVAIIHSFSGKLYGLRSNRNKKINQEKVAIEEN
ncbi:MAG: IS607 family transposase [Promethearchaeota archaeon]|nr:MAG: IS607 family transposase [Candidatus Lokiarchaeota archaeon]